MHLWAQRSLLIHQSYLDHSPQLYLLICLKICWALCKLNSNCSCVWKCPTCLQVFQPDTAVFPLSFWMESQWCKTDTEFIALWRTRLKRSTSTRTSSPLEHFLEGMKPRIGALGIELLGSARSLPSRHLVWEVLVLDKGLLNLRVAAAVVAYLYHQHTYPIGLHTPDFSGGPSPSHPIPKFPDPQSRCLTSYPTSLKVY